MASKDKENQKRSNSESVIRKFMRGMVKTVFWSYLSGVLIVIGLSIGLGVIVYYHATVYHIMKILQAFSIAVLGIMCLGILFKLSRKRTIILPLFVLAASFAVQNLTNHLSDVTRPKSAAKPTVISYKNKRENSQNALPDKSVNTSLVADNDLKIIPADEIYKNSLKIITEEPVLTFKIDKNTTAYSDIRRYLNKNKLPPKNSIRVEEIINYFPYDYALPETKEHPFLIQTTLTNSPWKKGSKLLHIGIKGNEQEMAKFPVADDTKIQIEFNPATVAEYRLIGYETHLIDQENLVNNQIDAGEINSGYTVTAIYEITPTDPLPLDKSEGTALVRVKYKLPGETALKTMEQAVLETTELDDASDDVRFAIAVAAFGEKLKNNRSVNWTWKDIRNLAKSAHKEDKDRQEFITLIKKTEALIKAEKYDPNC